LYVIGNGFDLMHGVRSSYYDFGSTLGKNSNIRITLENYLQVDDLWADFEGALAKINVEAMSQPYILDNLLDVMGAYEEDAQAADFFAAAEMAASPATELSRELKNRFTKWICCLQVNTIDRPLKELIRNGKFLDFNYTEFIEELYGVQRNDICYIHGCRKKKKGELREKLILGHQPQASDSQFDFEDDWSGINLSGNRAQMIYDAQQIAIREIVEADNELTKYCDRIIANHKEFFESLSDINKVITIGHSLYPVDWDYFAEVINQNKDYESVDWYFGCFSNGDLERIQDFIKHFNISVDRVHIFRTDTISVMVNKISSLTERKSGEKGNSEALEKILNVSENGCWKVCVIGNEIKIKNDAGNVAFSRVFSGSMNGAVFADEQTCFLVKRGTDKGVFLLRQVEGEWKYLGELEGIPNQGVITKRLDRILIDEDRVLFIYQNRVRIYNLSDGTLMINKAVRQAVNQQYVGKNLTEEFQKIYKGYFY